MKVNRKTIRLGPDGTPDPDGLTQIIVERGGSPDAELPHPIDQLAAWAHRELAARRCPSPGADARTLSGRAGHRLWQHSRRRLHTQDVLAARVLVAAIHCRAAIDRGDAAEAARHACVAAFHWQTRRYKPLEGDTVYGRRLKAGLKTARDRRNSPERRRQRAEDRAGSDVIQAFDNKRKTFPKLSRRQLCSRVAAEFDMTPAAVESRVRRAGRA